MTTTTTQQRILSFIKRSPTFEQWPFQQFAPVWVSAGRKTFIYYLFSAFTEFLFSLSPPVVVVVGFSEVFRYILVLYCVEPH